MPECAVARLHYDKVCVLHAPSPGGCSAVSVSTLFLAPALLIFALVRGGRTVAAGAPFVAAATASE